MIVGLGPQANFLDFNGFLRFASFAFLLRTLVEELAKIHHPADGRLGLRRNLNQIKPSVSRDVQRVSQRNDSKVFVLTIRPLRDQANLADTANLLVDSIISSADTILPTFQTKSNMAHRFAVAPRVLILA